MIWDLEFGIYLELGIRDLEFDSMLDSALPAINTESPEPETEPIYNLQLFIGVPA